MAATAKAAGNWCAWPARCPRSPARPSRCTGCVGAAPPPASPLHNTGGTDVKAAPPFDYFRYVFLPLLQRIGLDVRVMLMRRGYYPRGGGEVEVRVQPRPPGPPALHS